MNKQQITVEFIRENQGKYSKKKMGEILFFKHPDIYSSAEDARLLIRKVTGSSGQLDRKKVKDRIEWKGLSIPKPEKNDYSKVIVQEKRIGILSDIHFPYYDEAALNAALLYLLNWKPDCIILNGDTIDMYHASNFERDPSYRDLKYEFDMVRSFIAELVAMFPNVRIIYKSGNHCDRYESKILQRIPEFVTLGWMTLETALNWEQPYKIEIVKNKRLIKVGHLNIGHGHELSKGFIAPVNIARGFYMKTKSNFIGGHHHRISEHTETDINGKTVGAWSTGCLCELNPKYMPINSWNHGFATVEIINDNGDFRVKNMKIINGEVV